MTDPSILIFGAGKIGRSFIGQVFGSNGYGVVFVDMDDTLVEALNQRGSYPVVIKDPRAEETILVERVEAIHARDQEAVAAAISRASILATSVGKMALAAIIPQLAEGLIRRELKSPGRKLDVILAENMRDAAAFIKEELRKLLPPTYPLDEQLGLVETSIGKMVPIMSRKDQEADPLQVFAESYNTLILDRKGFRGVIPHIPEFSLKDHMKAWVDRKVFIHNLGHATAAYAGYRKDPDAVYMYEVLEDPEILTFTREVMVEAGNILMAAYPEEFSKAMLEDHIDDLLARFRNRSLGDTVYRVGCDLKRKLGPDDRFMAVIRCAQLQGLPHDRILEAMANGFLFRARDEQGKLFPEDADFDRRFREDPDRLLQEICGLDATGDAGIISALIHNT